MSQPSAEAVVLALMGYLPKLLISSCEAVQQYVTDVDVSDWRLFTHTNLTAEFTSQRAIAFSINVTLYDNELSDPKAEGRMVNVDMQGNVAQLESGDWDFDQFTVSNVKALVP